MADPKPTSQAFTVTLVGWRDRRGRFSEASKPARERVRTAARGALGNLKDAAIQFSPTGKRDVPKGVKPKTGPRFKDSWQTGFSETDSGADATLQNVAPHAGYVLFKTKPHPIAPVAAKALVFFAKDGTTAFSRGVHHPGTKGNPVLQKALEREQGSLKTALAKAVNHLQADIRDIFEA